MEEFSKIVNEFLEFRRYDILKDNGRISHKQAVEKAYQEYDIFNKTQPIESDFDKMVKGLAATGISSNRPSGNEAGGCCNCTLYTVFINGRTKGD